MDRDHDPENEVRQNKLHYGFVNNPHSLSANLEDRVPQISHLVRIRATPAAVYERLASTAGIAEWFTEAYSSDYREGGSLELKFPEETVCFSVNELAAPSRIVWHCITSESPWLDTDIVFEFEAIGEQTLVRFDHLGWPEITDLFRDCSMSWAYFLESLRTLIEEGRGTPERVSPPCESFI
jgi:uncharacterized protein YndB with AHSA1/START domain